jgi:gliding motility-associated-like protein
MRIAFSLLSLLLLSSMSFGQIQAGFIIDDTVNCVGGCATFTDTSSGVINSWQWSFAGGSPSSSTTQSPGFICYDVAGDYPVQLMVTGPSGTSTFASSIRIGTYPDSVQISADTIIDMGGTAAVSAYGFGGTSDFFWSPEEIFDCNTCSDDFASPLVTTYAVVEYFSADYCAVKDSILITVRYEDFIDVPNMFSPDDNGINDKVYVKGAGITSLRFRIFDRYGTLMFSTDDQGEGWDGTLNGQYLNPATFFWTAEYVLIDGTNNVKSGTITLIK